MKQEKIFLGLYRNASRFLLLLMMALLSGNAYAQTGNRSISGIVKDDLGEPLPGAHVAMVKVSSTDAVQAVATDINGHFQLTFPNNVKQITVSYIGFKQKTVNLLPPPQRFLRDSAGTGRSGDGRGGGKWYVYP